jgi:hypothetical protein
MFLVFANDSIEELPDTLAIFRDIVVIVMSSQLLFHRFRLLPDSPMPVLTAPLRDFRE